MANKPKQQERNRRATIEAMRREEQARERRKSIMFVVLAAVVGIGLVAAAVVPSYLDRRNDPANKDLSTFGVSAAQASCGEILNDPATGTSVHKPDAEVIDYAEVPPSSGPHWATPAYPARAFYTARDRPAMEQLVHNLEHGYTVLWYDDTIKGAQLDVLRDLAASARAKDPVGPNEKFIVSAWDDSYGTFDSGKHLALSHWGAEEGHRQLCGKISGAVVERFIEQFPSSDAPEPNGA